jgi:hypothetical protein
MGPPAIARRAGMLCVMQSDDFQLHRFVVELDEFLLLLEVNVANLIVELVEKFLGLAEVLQMIETVSDGISLILPSASSSAGQQVNHGCCRQNGMLKFEPNVGH